MPSALDLCTLAWGENPGFVALSVRDQTKDKKDKGYWVDKLYKWPDESKRIGEVLDKAQTASKDVYWSPTVFATSERTADAVTTSDVLYADLDEIDPRKLPKHLKPTAAWETSPGRFQAFWRMTTSLPASFQSNLNQRLTYAIGADKGGWGLSKVLRVPDTPNHKYVDLPIVKLLYMNGHTLDPSSLARDLPEISGPRLGAEELPDEIQILRKFRRKLHGRATQLIRAKHAERGVRSDRLWELECLLAEAGMKQLEIVAVVRATVWNKFEGRNNELPQLIKEAQKALDHTGAPTTDAGDDGVLEVVDEEDEVNPLTWSEFDRDHVPITWMVADVWGESEVGFISGLPKSYKSWLAIDLAVSVATGTRFLGTFQCKRHNVLLIQEEDPRPILQDRLAKVAGAKGLIYGKKTGPSTIEMRYELPDNLHVISNQGFSIDDTWMELLEEWIKQREIRLVILDPLMMIAGGGFDEFKAFEFMEQVLKPLKRVRARTGAAIVLVHHHIKGSMDAGAKSMYGSVALWAWEEAALHLSVTGVGKVTAERFSKHSLLPPILVEIGDVNDGWTPAISAAGAQGGLAELLATYESGATVEELTVATGLGRDTITRQVRDLVAKKKVEQSGTSQHGTGRPSKVWKVIHS